MTKTGFMRVAAAVPRVQPADVDSNTDAIISMIRQGRDSGAQLIVFPELCITGYTCADLFHNATLLAAVEPALKRIAEATAAENSPLVIVGAPVAANGTLYNCGVAIRGRIIAVIPKTYIPNYNEFYEKRWWHSAPKSNSLISLCGQDDVPFGTSILLGMDEAKIGVEICEDLWTPIPPSTRAALAGAEIIVNLSASNDIIGKYNYLRELISRQSTSCRVAYVYASAGYGESSTDLVFDGKAIIAENGSIISSNKRWQYESQISVTDIDLMAIRHDRLHNGSFADCADRESTEPYATVDGGEYAETPVHDIMRVVNPMPFVPSDPVRLKECCEETLNIQTAALCRRLDFTHCHKLVVGISGGLDSTLALLVAVRSFDKLGLDRKGIIAVTMPGFGTTGRTHSNALALMKALGVTIREISIAAAVRQHFDDIGHDENVHDVTYENSQARERTQILMDIANQAGGMVLGTGDLSELALGWATYNGDHMSMYGINASVPKTLIRHIVRYIASESEDEACRDTLNDIVDTPISPELTPVSENGDISQFTEDLVGPYELHDFFLYYTLRFGFSPRHIYDLAQNAFAGRFDGGMIRKWIKVFFRRFFAQQFKRSCLPDGPKVGSVCLSPRGDWRMPSDLSASLWLKECDSL